MKHSVRIKQVGGFFPDEKQTLLLKAALFPSPEASTHFTNWLSLSGLENLNTESDSFLSDFMDILDIGSQRMLPLVIYNVGEHNHPYFKLLLGIRKNFWVKNKQIAFRAQKVQQIFDRNNIPNILIKGLDLAARYYPNDALRPMNDGDVLVPYSYREQALKLAMENAFGNKIATYDFYMKDFVHAIHLDFEGSVDIDLHWNIFVEYYNDLTATDFIWQNIQTVNINNVPTKRMSDTHAFFVSLVHGRSFDLVPPFRWVADTMMIVRNAKSIDWNEILTLTQKFHFKPFLKRAFPYLKQEFGMDIPDSFLSALAKIQPVSLEVTYHQLLAKDIRESHLFSLLWYGTKKRIIFYQLFLKDKNSSFFNYFSTWLLNRLKTRYFVKKAKNATNDFRVANTV